ncbi:MAG: DNA/RNA non-specific endonuclease [Filimonas sp.]|nr:DNA/RNA non-specific endonuclease [Filimonas sp.]
MSILIDAFSKEKLLACKGYNTLFIDKNIPVNHESIVPTSEREKYPEVEGNKKGLLHYSDLTVLYNSDRKVPFVSAYNIDGTDKQKVSRTSFRPEPRIKTALQLDNAFYDLRKDGPTEFEIGHMAANNEMAWGTDAQLRAYRTFFFTNSVPQAEVLNTGIWKSLESYIITEAAAPSKNKKIAVFTGPVLKSNDPQYIEDKRFQIPLLFYKVVVFPTTKGLFSTGFVMSHQRRLEEMKMFAKTYKIEKAMVAKEPFTDFQYKTVFQMDMGALEELTGLNFKWKGVQRLKVPNDMNQVKKIRKVRDSKDAKDAIKKTEKMFLPRSSTQAPALTMILPS